MAILKKEYELSVWDEILAEKGQKQEIKRAIIGSDNMDFLGKATSLQLKENLNGTHTLTFQLPSKFFDSELGKYIHNEFCDYLFNEKKLKLKYRNQWYEFYIKNITENKQFKSIMYQYTCQDAFIDELSRNGYGITFDTELYNNVEELGVFNEEILKDSIWQYDSSKNVGDFTEYSEEKFFKVPLTHFKNNTIQAYKLNYELSDMITNVFTKKQRKLELGDDLAREQKQFWDNGNFDKGLPLLEEKVDVPNDGYIYIPYSELNFCYIKTKYLATEEPLITEINGIKSYALAPNSIDPSSLIQFIAIPNGEEVQIDESGLLVNKNLSYVITVKDWNDIINTNKWYDIDKSIQIDEKNDTSNGIITYDGYLEKINDIELTFGKKISISNRTEINISEDIDQYVTIYNNTKEEYGYNSDGNMFISPEEWKDEGEIDYRICSYDATRVIVPQLARNLVQNGTDMTDNSGWDNMKTSELLGSTSGSIEVNILEADVENTITETNGLKLMAQAKALNIFGPMKVYDYFSNVNPIPPINFEINPDVQYPSKTDDYMDYHTFLNFGIIGQEETLQKGQTYLLYMDARIFETAAEIKEAQGLNYCSLIIGEGDLDSYGNYTISKDRRIGFNFVPPNQKQVFIDNSVDSSVQNLIKPVTEDHLKELKIKYPTLEFGKFYFIRVDKDIKNPYFGIILNPYKAEWLENTGEETSIIEQHFNTLYLTKSMFFKAYTRGVDFFPHIEDSAPEGYQEGKYRYTGRDIFYKKDTEGWIEWENKDSNLLHYRIAENSEFITETDIIEGDAYSYKRYFIQQLQTNDGTEILDTFGLKSYLNNDIESNGLDSTKYTDDDYSIVTNYIDLNQCPHFKGNVAAAESDCGFSGGICLYQKYGYCPYLFKTQKHCRKIRTLNGEKSNRFNLTQELSKVFEVYPVYYIEHKENGKIETDLIDSNGNIVDSSYEDETYERMRKKVFYITEKGMENKLGFRYEKNLANISRTLDSSQIVTKLYVEDVDSNLSKTGLCSIKTAEDNPSKDSYIIDFSYYVLKNILDGNIVNNDLYGQDDNDMGYLKQLGYYNTEYDKLSNKIINLQDQSYTELTANIDINLVGIEVAQQELGKINKKLNQYGQPKQTTNDGELQPISLDKQSDAYKTYKIKSDEQKNILLGLIESTFFTEDICMGLDEETAKPTGAPIKISPDAFLKIIDKIGFKRFKQDYLDTFMYTGYGMMGQYAAEYNQIREWKKERATYLKKINQISLDFYQKYEPYLKEGTWSDSNYLSDNTYYFGAKEVAKQGAIPKVTYNITVTDLEVLDKKKDYVFNIADTTYIEDIETFGINSKTGLPNRLKVIISGITYNLDQPMLNSIEIQNYTSQFEDLFGQIAASVQSLSFNENIYKRSSNFTATKNVEGDSLQGALEENQLTILETDEGNLEFDYTGQSGSDINNHNHKYKLDGQGLFFSNDGGQTWNTGVGPKGINASYITVGTLDAARIQIVDGNYLYFLWDKTGISAYRSPQATGVDNPYFEDYARFNKYGLSLVENGKIRLRSGYNYNYTGSTEETTDPNRGRIGDYETDITTDSTVGFFLYNNNGQVIFKTEAQSSLRKEGETDDEYNARQRRMTARLSLAGEIFVTDSRLEDESTGTIVGIRYKVELRNAYKINQKSDTLKYTLTNLDDNTIILLEGGAVITEQDIDEHEAGELNYNKLVITDVFERTDGQIVPLTTSIPFGLVSQNGRESLYYNIVKNYTYTVNRLVEYMQDTVLVDSVTSTYRTAITSTDDLLREFKNLTPNGMTTINYLYSQDNVEEDYWAANQNIPILYNMNYYDCTTGAGIKENTTKQLYQVYAVVNQNYNYWEVYNLTTETSYIENEDSEITEEIGLFINNKLSLEQEEVSTDPEVSKRIFSCIISTDKYNEDNSEDINKRNILSILKNGQLMIGGTVKGANDLDLADSNMSEIPDEIKISNPQILMTQEGIIKMDFDNFQNMNGESLSQTISSAVASMRLANHNHDMDTVNISVSDNPDKRFYIALAQNTIAWDTERDTFSPLFLRILSAQLTINLENNINNYLTLSDEEFETKMQEDFGVPSGIKRIIIPITDQMYKATGVTGSRGSGPSDSSPSGQQAGYYLIDPLQI